MEMQGVILKEVLIKRAPQSLDAAAVAARRRFVGGSARHMAAMASFPSSRRLEVAPFSYLLPENRKHLMDLFAGTGFASNSVREFFENVALVEPHVAPEATGAQEPARYRACALSASSFRPFPKADLAVCLAGFHHVLGPGIPEDKAAHRQQRLEALRLWRSAGLAGCLAGRAAGLLRTVSLVTKIPRVRFV